MTAVAVMMVRDEQDVVGRTITHLLANDVDAVIVADNLSTDDTPAILHELEMSTGRVFVHDDPEPGYYQADKMTRLAVEAADLEADWVIPVDADEVWQTTTGESLGELFARQPADVLFAAEFKHWPHPDDRPADANPLTRMRHRETEAHRLPKVAFRAHPAAKLHMGNHDVDREGTRVAGLLEVRHFPYRSAAQFRRKVRNGRDAYEASNLHQSYGTHWREMGAYSDAELEALWDGLCDGRPFEHRWVGHGDLTLDPADVRGQR